MHAPFTLFTLLTIANPIHITTAKQKPSLIWVISRRRTFGDEGQMFLRHVRIHFPSTQRHAPADRNILLHRCEHLM